MDNIRLPGAFWVALITAAMIVLQEYVADPIYYQIGLAVVMAVLKAFNLRTDEVKRTIEEIEKELDRGDPSGVHRSAQRRVSAHVEEPNRLAAWLLG